jgi:2-polyprenyl-3-methyl-5-hydroxy-6-metoxy-1,4-benzoquinol methylase
MGEIFARPVPVTALPFTGERLTSEFGGQTEMEHLHRYMLARHLCRGKDVLDIACGEGYGTALLGQAASTVIGVEVAEDAVAHAIANYARANLCFRRGDARRIPLDDGSVDVVVSFETIEHIDEQETFLAEVRRVLRPGGKLIVSTPDRDSYSPADQPANPYHVMELTREEFVRLLNRHFRHVSMLWQRTLAGSALLPGPEASAMAETLCFERRGDTRFEMSTGYARPQYLVAVCSDVPPTPLPSSVYIDTSNINTLAAEQDRAHAAEAAMEDARRRATAAEAAFQAEKLRAAAAEAATEDALRRATAAEAASQAEQVRAADAEARATVAAATFQAEQVRAAAAEASFIALEQKEKRLLEELETVRSTEQQQRTELEILRGRSFLQRVLHKNRIRGGRN